MKNRKNKLNGKALVALALSIEFGLVAGIGFSFPFINKQNSQNSNISNLITNKDLGTIDYRKVDLSNNDDVLSWIKNHLKVNHGIDSDTVDKLIFGTPVNGVISITVDSNQPIVLKGVKYTGSTNLTFKETHSKYTTKDLTQLFDGSKSLEAIVQEQYDSNKKAISTIAIDDSTYGIKAELAKKYGVELSSLNSLTITPDLGNNKIHVDGRIEDEKTKTVYIGSVDLDYTLIGNSTYVDADGVSHDVSALETSDTLNSKNYKKLTSIGFYLSTDGTIKASAASNTIESVELNKQIDSRITSLNKLFYLNTSLKNFVVNDYFDITNITNLSSMFYGCSSLTSLDLSNWNTSNVTNMSGMFGYCSSITTIDLSNWNTSSVTNMSQMFIACNSTYEITNIENFDTSKVTDMSSMFSACWSLPSIDLAKWDVKNVTNMNSMFSACSSLTSLDLSKWDTSNVEYMDEMFSNCKKLSELILGDKFNTLKVTDMSYMFVACSVLKSLDLSSFDTSSVTNMSAMFSNCGNLIELNGLSKFNTSKVTDMSYMFCSIKLTALDLSSFDTSKVTNMSYMFSNDSVLTKLDINENMFNTSNVTDMTSMFWICSKLTLDASWFNVDNVSAAKHDNFNTNADGITPPTWKDGN